MVIFTHTLENNNIKLLIYNKTFIMLLSKHFENQTKIDSACILVDWSDQFNLFNGFLKFIIIIYVYIPYALRKKKEFSMNLNY